MDLFVRKSNQVAINMYKNLGYIVYRTILEYYSGDQDEDAYGELIAYSMNISPDHNYNQTICYPSTPCRYAKGAVERCV